MKKLSLLLLIVTLFGVAGVGAYLWRQLTPNHVIEVSCNPVAPRADRYAVRIIGNSWVAGQKMDAGIAAAASANGVDMVLTSEGISGARSKRVGSLLQNAVNWHETQVSDRKLVLVVEGGINDRIGNLGSEFYVTNLEAIVNAAKGCGAIVAIMTIPPFDKFGTKRSAFDLARWRFYAWLSGDRTDSVATEYNARLANELKDEIASGAVIILDSTKYIKTEEIPTRFRDGVHLKPEEMEKFSRSIGSDLFLALQDHRMSR